MIHFKINIGWFGSKAFKSPQLYYTEQLEDNELRDSAVLIKIESGKSRIYVLSSKEVKNLFKVCLT